MRRNSCELGLFGNPILPGVSDCQLVLPEFKVTKVTIERQQNKIKIFHW